MRWWIEYSFVKAATNIMPPKSWFLISHHSSCPVRWEEPFAVQWCNPRNRLHSCRFLASLSHSFSSPRCTRLERFFRVIFNISHHRARETREPRVINERRIGFIQPEEFPLFRCTWLRCATKSDVLMCCSRKSSVKNLKNAGQKPSNPNNWAFNEQTMFVRAERGE